MCPWRTLCAQAVTFGNLTNFSAKLVSLVTFPGRFAWITRCVRKTIESSNGKSQTRNLLKHNYCIHRSARLSSPYRSNAERDGVQDKNKKFSISQWNAKFSRKIYSPFDCTIVNLSISTIISFWFSLNSAMIDDKIWKFQNSCTYPLWSTNRERTQRKFVSCQFVSANGSFGVTWCTHHRLNVNEMRSCGCLVCCQRGHIASTIFNFPITYLNF